jgi:hypothetical protein
MFGISILQLIGIAALAIATAIYKPDSFGCRDVDSSGIRPVWCVGSKPDTTVPSTSKKETFHESTKIPKVEEETSVLRP